MLQEITARTPKAITAKALYSKLLGLQSGNEEANLCFSDSSENLSQLLARYILRYGRPPGLNKVEDFKLLRQEFSVALRHKEDQYNLCLEVCKQSLEKGLPYVTFGVSPAARLLKRICKEVAVEVNSAKGLNFKPHPQNYSIYWVEYRIYHDTADLILKYFAKRYPMRILLIKDRRRAYWLKNGQIYRQDNQVFSLASIDKKLDQKTFLEAAP